MALTKRRTLVTFTCRCGITVQNYLRANDPRVCLDCKQQDDRNANGWTPTNSID